MRRSVIPIGPLLGLGLLAACGRAPPESAKAAPPAAPASHNWAAMRGKTYLYYPRAHAEGGRAAAEATVVRYLGRQPDGAFLVSEGEGAALVLASCLLPCEEARVRGGGMEHTGPFGGDSVTRAALDDAVKGRLEVFVPAAQPQDR